MLMPLVVLLAMLVLNVVNAQDVENVANSDQEDLNAAQNSSQTEKQAEIKALDNQSAIQENKEVSGLKGDTATNIQKSVKKDISEDEAIGEVEAKEAPEPVVEDDNEGSSWFSWLWPFGGSDDNKEVASPKAVKSDKNSSEPAIQPIEEKTEGIVETTTAIGTQKTSVEPQVAADNVANEETTQDSDIVDKLVYYVPNLFLDFFDIFSCGAGVGAKAGIQLELTNAFTLGGNYGDVYFVEKAPFRRYGGGYDRGYDFQLGPLASEKRFVDEAFGGVPEYIIKESKAQVQKPSAEIFTKPMDADSFESGVSDNKPLRDYWEVGIKAGWLLNISLHLHPVEIADFFTGIFFYDLTGDNISGDDEETEAQPATVDTDQDSDTTVKATEEETTAPADDDSSDADDDTEVDEL